METAQAIASLLVRADAWACIAGLESEVPQISIRNSNVEAFTFVRSSPAGSVSDQGIGLRFLWIMKLSRFLNSKPIS